jgi:hypothetical protein
MCEKSTFKLILDLFSAPLTTYPSILTILSDESCSDACAGLIAATPFQLRYAMALAICRNIVDRETHIIEPDHISRLLGHFIAPLIKDQRDGGLVSGTGKLAGGEKADMEELKDDQGLVARMVHLLSVTGQPDQQFVVST